LRFVILGAPATKKNHSRIFRNQRTGKPFVVPSEQAMAWAKSAEYQLRAQDRQSRPNDKPVNVRATIYRARRTGDLNNFLAAIADSLEAAGVVVNDRLIEGWDGSRLRHDKVRPRVELEIVDMAFVDGERVEDIDLGGGKRK